MHKIQTLALLVAAYAAATWFPGPGLRLREVELSSYSIQLPQLLLAALLFCAGISSSHGAIRTILHARGRLLKLVLAVWLLPLIAAIVAVLTLWGLLGCPASVALGIFIVAAMPVANSSVGWSTSMGGSVTLSIALLVVGTALSPLITPAIINLSAVTVGTAERNLRETPWNEGMALFFLLWVLAPVLVGILIAGRLGAPQRQRLLPVARRCSFVILISLNYLNGSACLPPLAQQPQLLFWPLLGAAVLLLTSYANCRLFTLLPFLYSRPSGLSAEEQVSLLLSVVMRNTGAALVFAGAALPEFTLVSITIVAYTMLQHLWVGFFLSPKRGQEPLPLPAPPPDQKL